MGTILEEVYGIISRDKAKVEVQARIGIHGEPPPQGGSGRKATTMATQTIERSQAVRVLPTPKVIPGEQGKQEGFWSKLAQQLVKISSIRAIYRLDHQYRNILSPREQALLAKELAWRHGHLNGAGMV